MRTSSKFRQVDSFLLHTPKIDSRAVKTFCSFQLVLCAVELLHKLVAQKHDMAASQSIHMGTRSAAKIISRCGISRVRAEVATGARAGSSWARGALHGERKLRVIHESRQFLKTGRWGLGCREFQLLQQSVMPWKEVSWSLSNPLSIFERFKDSARDRKG